MPSAAPPPPSPPAFALVPAQASTPVPAAFEWPIAKFCELHLFSGATIELELFLDEVNNTICMQRMVLDLNKMNYLVSYLKDGNPKTWYYAIKAHSPHLLFNYHTFVAELCHSFADPNISHMLLPHLDWSKTIQLDQFKEGLKDAILNKICEVHPKPATFDEYIELTIKFDNKLHEDELACKDHSCHNYPQPRPGPHTFPQPRPQPPASAAPAPPSDVIPIKVNAVCIHSPLTQAEKD
ncbi:hypothetical protein OBBRIDRAFT_839431 [Obba rivulosa]|uniref:Uncharacterized protein n=1 Tax=Obba rivulosa TaxID=1052685 RepID=A0A8E2AK22_9APHY|nr:hypothetical protein OBBRIDRAFT_839431 [Obba rivulosa]